MASPGRPTRQQSSQQRLHRLFKISIILKGLDGVFEIMGGVLFLVIRPETLNRVVYFFTAHELSEDPHDWIAGIVRHGTAALSPGTQRFASIYLLGHGIIKVLLVAGLWRGKLWAYPTALTVLGAFIIYQVYRLSHTHSVALFAFTVFDLIVVFFIWREYRAQRRSEHAEN